MKVGFSSDHHIDLNRIDWRLATEEQANFLHQQGVSYYFLLGDASNHYEQTQQYVNYLQAQLAPQTEVRFILGNHDMSGDLSFNQVETLASPLYLHNRYLDLAGTNWRVIGHNGWYDYGFSPMLDETSGEKFHHGFYYDRIIQQPMSDWERTNLAIQQLQVQLVAAAAANKQVIVVTHFVPIDDDIHLTNERPFMQLNAVLGSPRLGALLEANQQVRHVLFGHHHVTSPVRRHRETAFYNVSVGLKKRSGEWLASDFLTSWQKKLVILQL